MTEALIRQMPRSVTRSLAILRNFIGQESGPAWRKQYDNELNPAREFCFGISASPCLCVEKVDMTQKIKKLLGLLILIQASFVVVEAQTPTPSPSTQNKITEYSLSPELHAKAHTLNRLYFRHRLVNFAWALAVLLAVVYFRVGARFRSLAERVSKRLIVQSLVFSPLIVLTLSLFQLPLDAYIHNVSVQFGLSIQSWPSWFWDWIKEQLLVVVAASFFVWLLYLVIRRSPRRWWFYFWVASLPIALFIVFIYPFVIDPLFHRFEPLAQKDPALTASLTKLAQRAGEDIPEDRMFWMQAGDKTTTLNAYVTGFGASKRIVVWDTTIKKMTTPQIVFVAGHETGHYVLNHLQKGLLLSSVSSLLAFYIAFLALGWIVRLFGARLGIRSIDDIASLPLMLLMLTVLMFASNPIANAVSRYYEHQADQYALEITHGLTTDSAQVAAQAFQVLGEVGLSDPDPDWLNVFLFYSHPPISERVRFSLEYDPWSKGEAPKFVTP